MQVSDVNDVISDLCIFLRREIFHEQGDFFDKNGTLQSFLNSAIMKDLVFKQN
jgi:hypothetical protein